MKTWKEIKQDVDTKLWNIKCDVEFKAKQFAKWASDNKELAIALIPVGIAGIKMIGNAAKSIDRKIDLAKEEELQELYVYDHSLGMYHKLRRPMRPSEKVELDRRHRNGESKIQILSSMGLLD